MNFDDGNTHIVDFEVDDGVSISNSSTLNVQNGASIATSAQSGEAIHTEDVATINIQNVFNGLFCIVFTSYA